MELILWTASGLRSGKERILRLMLHFTHWALSCTELSAPGACAGPRLGWWQREERRSLLTAGNLRWKALGLCGDPTANALTAFTTSWMKSGWLENGGLGMAKGNQAKLSCVWSENVALCVCCGTCGLHRRVTDGTQELLGKAWTRPDVSRLLGKRQRHIHLARCAGMVAVWGEGI